MRITVFTSNQPRHLNLINRLSAIADECFAVVETSTIFPGLFHHSESFKEYFSYVIDAEKKIFGDIQFSKEIRNLIIQNGDLNKIDKSILEPALKADVYVVFGSSFIKGWLVDHLVSHNAVNIHMGISPYYRGSSCNFWALYDGNPHLMGATIHRLSKGLDSGDILYHVGPSTLDCANPFDFTMMSVKLARKSFVERLSSGDLHKYQPIIQDSALEVRYSRSADFTDEIAKEFLDRHITISEISDAIFEKQNNVDYIEPYG